MWRPSLPPLLQPWTLLKWMWAEEGQCHTWTSLRGPLSTQRKCPPQGTRRCPRSPRHLTALGCQHQEDEQGGKSSTWVSDLGGSRQNPAHSETQPEDFTAGILRQGWSLLRHKNQLILTGLFAQLQMPWSILCLSGNFTQRWYRSLGSRWRVYPAELSREREKTQHLKTDNLSKAHLYAESTTPSGDSLKKERKFASVCLERIFINGCEKVSTCQHFPR